MSVSIKIFKILNNVTYVFNKYFLNYVIISIINMILDLIFRSEQIMYVGRTSKKEEGWLNARTYWFVHFNHESILQ